MDIKDREFIDSVWRKVRYLEYLKIEDLKVRENNKKLFLMKIKLGAFLLMGALIIIIPLLLGIGFNLFSIFIIGLVTLGEGNLYEYLLNINFNREVKNEN